MTHIQGITSFPKGAPGPSGTACQNPAPIGLTLDRPILTEESGRSRYLTLPLLAVALLTFSQLFGCGGSGGGGDKSSSRQLFEVVIENVSTPQTLLGPSKQPVPVVLSPVLFVVHSSSHPIFTAGQIAGNGLEVMAEEGDPTELINSLQTSAGIGLIGIAQTPVGETSASVLLPGSSYKTVIRAEQGEQLSLVSSFLQANDLFISTPDTGIPLFDSAGTPFAGDVTAQLLLLDAGTEVNERPGFGANQSPRQTEPNSGTVESNPVSGVADSFTYPAVAGMVKVTINPI